MNLTLSKTMSNSKKECLMNCQKQSQTNPIQTQSNLIYSVFIRVHSWLNSKQSQSKPILSRLSAIAFLSVEALAKTEATAEARPKGTFCVDISGKLF
jgi:hypothetical protein